MEKAIKAARFGDQIRDSIAAWSRQDLPGFFFTIVQVSLTPDLSRATIWVSALDEAELKVIVTKLRHHEREYGHRLRTELGKHVVPMLRFVPTQEPTTVLP